MDARYVACRNINRTAAESSASPFIDTMYILLSTRAQFCWYERDFDGEVAGSVFIKSYRREASRSRKEWCPLGGWPGTVSYWIYFSGDEFYSLFLFNRSASQWALYKSWGPFRRSYPAQRSDLLISLYSSKLRV